MRTLIRDAAPFPFFSSRPKPSHAFRKFSRHPTNPCPTDGLKRLIQPISAHPKFVFRPSHAIVEIGKRSRPTARTPTRKRTTKMSSDARINASRENGALGGPKTDSGKAVSSQNATTHGAYTRNVVLTTEDQEIFNQFHRDYLAEWQPIGRTECDLVTQITVSAWKIRRLYPVDTCLWELAMARQADEIKTKHGHIEAEMRNAFAFELLAEAPALASLNRAENHLRRQMDRAIRVLRVLQKDRKAGNRPGAEPQTDLAQNEPTTPDFSIPKSDLIHGYILPAVIKPRPNTGSRPETPPRAA